MGKTNRKSKRKSSHKNSSSSNPKEESTLPNVSSNQGTENEPKQVDGAGEPVAAMIANGGIYATYKKSTEAVKEWAVLSWKGKKASENEINYSIGKKHNRTKNHRLPLSTIIANLHELAERNTVMPAPIFRDLKMAIRLRRQASLYYYDSTGQEGSSHNYCDGHRWIIHQLVSVYRAFLDASRRVRHHEKQKNNEKQANAAETDGITDVENRFAALYTDSGDESSLGQEDEETLLPKLPAARNNPPPSEAMVQEEERHFAIACTLLELERLRQHIRSSWKEWVSMYATKTTPEKVMAREMIAASCISRYAVLMAKSSIMRTCVEFDAFPDFEEILQRTPSAAAGFAQQKQRKFDLGQRIILAGLTANPDFNDQGGTVCSLPDDCRDRYGVRLGNRKIISVKAGNMLPDDDLLFGLNQVYKALLSFDFAAVPTVERVLQIQHLEVQSACQALMMDAPVHALRCLDRKALLQYMVKRVLPLWAAFGDFVGGESMPTDSLFFAYMRDYRNQRTIQFHWVYFLLCMVDSCLDCLSANNDSHGRATGCMDSVLHEVTNSTIYQAVIDVVNGYGDGDDFTARYNSNCITLYHIRKTWSPMTTFFPWISGDLLLHGLRLNFIVSTCMPYLFRQDYIALLHLYSMLRQERYITPIPEIDGTLIRMYRRRVFFRSGVPTSNTGSYYSSWQVSAGMNAQSVHEMKGGDRAYRGSGRSKHAEDRTGHHLTEISRLLAIVQWHDVGVYLDPSVCFDEIRKVVRDEFDALFLAPLMKTCVQMDQLKKVLAVTCGEEPRAFGERCVPYHEQEDFEETLAKHSPLHGVFFWACVLVDNPFYQEEIQRGLRMVASCFGTVFGERCLAIPEGVVSYPPLSFNPNEHSVSSAFFGEEGAARFGQFNKL
jgi:hypothetical protein